jgi:hypothetical protein
VDGISRQGRPTTGVRVMQLGDGAKISAIAPVAEEIDDDGQSTLPT